MTTTQTVPLEPGNRIQLPADWAQALGLAGVVVLEKTAEGIVVRPIRRKTWDEIFANKLIINSAPPADNEDDLDDSGDDFIF